jgi:PAS domain S-box-containing protein
LAVEQNPIGVIMTDLAGTITYTNPAFIQMSGYGLGEILGQKASLQSSGLTPPETYDFLVGCPDAGKNMARRVYKPA